MLVQITFPITQDLSKLSLSLRDVDYTVLQQHIAARHARKIFATFYYRIKNFPHPRTKKNIVIWVPGAINTMDERLLNLNIEYLYWEVKSMNLSI